MTSLGHSARPRRQKLRWAKETQLEGHQGNTTHKLCTTTCERLGDMVAKKGRERAVFSPNKRKRWHRFQKFSFSLLYFSKCGTEPPTNGSTQCFTGETQRWTDKHVTNSDHIFAKTCRMRLFFSLHNPVFRTQSHLTNWNLWSFLHVTCTLAKSAQYLAQSTSR